jgi:hypothetical protein
VGEYKQLFIWVEGPKDERYCESILKSRLISVYDNIDIVKYANRPPKWRRDFLNSINSMNAEYLYLSDINGYPCVTDKKTTIISEITNIDPNKVFVVKKEIESWYLAGIDDNFMIQTKMKPFSNTENICKEEFNAIIPKKFNNNAINFMIEILKVYSLDKAKLMNSSFRYLSDKIGI